MLKSSALVFFIKVFAAALSFFLIALLSEHLEAEETGKYLYWMSLLTVIGSFTSLGFNNILLKETSIYCSKSKEEEASAIVNASLLLSVVFSLVVAFIIYVYDRITFGYDNEYLLFFLMAIPLFTTIAMLSHALQGVGALFYSMFIVGVVQPLSLIFLLYFNLVESSLISVAKWYFYISIFIFLLSYLVFYNKVGGVMKFNYPIMKHWRACFSLVIYQFFQQYNMTIGQVLLGFHGLHTQVAAFVICLKVATLTSFIMFAVNRVVAPDFAVKFKNNDFVGLQKSFFKAKRLMLAGVAPFLIIMLCAPEWILSFFGEEYKVYSDLLLSLVVIQVIIVYCGPVPYLLVMANQESKFKNYALASAFVGSVIGLALISHFPLIGAYLASLIAILTMQFLSSILVYKKFKINVLKI